MVGLGGLEPPTSPLSGVRSNNLSYKPLKAYYLNCHLEISENQAEIDVYSLNKESGLKQANVLTYL